MTHSVQYYLLWENQYLNKKNFEVKADFRPEYPFLIIYQVLSFQTIIEFRFQELIKLSHSDWKLDIEDCFLDYQPCISFDLSYFFEMNDSILSLSLAQLWFYDF